MNNPGKMYPAHFYQAGNILLCACIESGGLANPLRTGPVEP